MVNMMWVHIYSNNLPLGPQILANNVHDNTSLSSSLLSYSNILKEIRSTNYANTGSKLPSLIIIITRPINDHNINKISNIDQVWMYSMEIT